MVWFWGVADFVYLVRSDGLRLRLTNEHRQITLDMPPRHYNGLDFTPRGYIDLLNTRAANPR